LETSIGSQRIGWENIELIIERPFEIWLDEFKKCKDRHPEGCCSPGAVKRVAKEWGWALFVALDADHDVEIEDSSRGGDGGESAL
jgi:dihydropyrimidine dehydrogenase (NADP+)/dihydropyrimidine dehydrogenase (NAD+) subunit PreA